jgi:cobalt/nickel transport system ATP-binding protein
LTIHSLVIEELVHVYPDGTRALDGMHLTVTQGERVALLGPNGAGKSTLILHTNGVLMPQAGTVTVDGIELGSGTARDIRAKVGLVFQDPDDQLFMASVYDDVAFGPLNMGLSAKEVDALVHDALHAVGLAEVTSRAGSHLSFGQKKRVALATVLSMSPSILVLDEPTSNLDPRSRRQMVDLLLGLSTTQLVATHDMDLAWELCSRAVLIDEGKVVADGPSRTLMADAPLMQQHGLEVPAAVRYGG